MRYTKCAAEGDYAAISRVGENSYELRILRQQSPNGNAVAPYAVNFIGHQGKKYGFMSNLELERVTGIRAGSRISS